MRAVTCVALVLLTVVSVSCAGGPDPEKPIRGAIAAGGAAGEGRATATTQPTPEGLRLYRLIMEYRASQGLPEIPLSPSLTFVAQAHVRDLQVHYRGGGGCNFHSWSAAGDWTPCCYTSDHAQAECMWNKPQELTDYEGYGFEIAYYSSGGADATGALQSWRGSSLHNAVVVNDGIWQEHPWGAIGVGIYGNYACVWFGEEPDPHFR